MSFFLWSAKKKQSKIAFATLQKSKVLQKCPEIKLLNLFDQFPTKENHKFGVREKKRRKHEKIGVEQPSQNQLMFDLYSH